MAWTPYNRYEPNAANEVVVAAMITSVDEGNGAPTEFVGTIATARGDRGPIFGWREDGASRSYLIYVVSRGQIARIGRVLATELDTDTAAEVITR